MGQILVTVDGKQSLQRICKAIDMLRGVVSTTVVKEPSLSKAERQQAYVADSLARAFSEVKQASFEGKALQSVDDFLNELDEE